MPWSRTIASGSGRCWRLSWHPPVYWSSPGALVVRRRPVLSRSWIRVMWVGIPYTVLSEILESDDEAFRARYLYRVTEGEKVISEEEIIGYAYRPVWDVIQRELVSAGFTQTEGAERLLAWRLA